MSARTALAGVVLVAAVAVAAAALGSSDAPQPKSGEEASSAALATWRSKPIGVLRRRREPGDRPPQTTSIPDEFRVTFGIDVDEARFAASAPGESLYIAPGTDGLCLLDAADIVTSCWATRLALNGDALVSSLCSANLAPNTIKVAGVVPDGIRSVSIPRARFGRTVAPVRSNVFSIVLPGGNPLPFKASWVKDGRRETRLTGIPVGTKYRPCTVAGGRGDAVGRR